MRVLSNSCFKNDQELSKTGVLCSFRLTKRLQKHGLYCSELFSREVYAIALPMKAIHFII